MRKITIHDANILIDLTNLNLTVKFFQLNFEFHTTDLAFDEISEGLKKKELSILLNNLNIKTFEEAEFKKIIEENKKYKILSIQDHSILELSLSLQGILCTGDKKLKKIAENKGIETHGTLWIIEQLVSSKHLSCKEAIEKLNQLKENNPRIPKTATRKLIKKYSCISFT